jgi:NAD+ synthase (glutamine-hydrolysing)
MPSQFSSDHSINDARELAQNLNIQYDLIQIESVYKAYEEVLKPHFVATNFDVTEENIQARIRGMLLMSFSNKFGHIVLNTSNKSESAVGYGTLYGDMAGGLSVIADLYKTEVYELAHYMNKDGEILPTNIITKPPSAELRPDQFDSDSLPDYDILDTILYQYIEKRKGPKALVKLGFDEKLVTRILKMVDRNEFKRAQMAPVLRVSSKAFGMGRRIPIVGKYLS